LLIRQFNLFVNAMIPAGHRLRKPTADEMTHYRNALGSADRRNASAVLPRAITASRAFLADVEAKLADVASLPTLIVWGDADIAFGSKERQRWEQTFTDHHTAIIEGAGHFVQSDAPAAFAAAIREWWFGRLLSSLHGSSVATSCGEQIAAPAIRAKGV
jgi:haloalkane dehalogenase